jgi:hypothetical protein
MRVMPQADSSRFVDSMEVRAGALTPMVWLGAFVLCRSRMRRLRRLITILE